MALFVCGVVALAISFALLVGKLLRPVSTAESDGSEAAGGAAVGSSGIGIGGRW